MTWNQTWVEDALCAQADPESFFPEAQGQTAESRKAKAICRKCPVITQCYDYALHNAEWGIWGGTSMNERIKARKRHGITLFSGWVEHGTEAGARAHYRRRERPCPECLDAANRAARERQKSRAAE